MPGRVDTVLQHIQTLRDEARAVPAQPNQSALIYPPAEERHRFRLWVGKVRRFLEAEVGVEAAESFVQETSGDQVPIRKLVQVGLVNLELLAESINDQGEAFFSTSEIVSSPDPAEQKAVEDQSNEVQIALTAVREQFNELIEIRKTAESSGQYSLGIDQIHRWRRRTAKRISDDVAEAESYKFTASEMVVNRSDGVNFTRKFDRDANALFALHDELQKHGLRYIRPTQEQSATGQTSGVANETDADKQGATPMAQQDKKKVFLIYGHDLQFATEVSNFLLRHGLQVIDLSREAGGGRTLIELLHENRDVVYAVALLTPDDVGAQKHDPFDESKLRPRARQNVIFELGLFQGMATRARVAAIVKKDAQGNSIELPSDLGGVKYIAAEGTGDQSWAFQLQRELQAVGVL